ncbi:MAG: hypothetical protein EBX50_02235 [Chitinophagia bacterium]|nr:hypothetical protein [Chitinophagia bacterium]
MRFISIFLVQIACLQTIFGQTQMSSGGVLDALQVDMDIRHYDIHLRVNTTEKTLDGYTEVSFLLAKPADTILLQLIDAYKITQVTLNNQPVNFQHNNNRILIWGKQSFPSGKQVIKVTYAGNPPIAIRPPWQGGFTFTKDSFGNPWMSINSQFEGGKIYFPCKDHPSDEPNEGVDFYITVSQGEVVAAAGLLQEVKKLKNGLTTYHWKTNYPISNYCILFNIGKYAVFKKMYTTINGNTVPIELYLLTSDSAHANEIFEIKERDTRILEKYFGEYPWVKEKIGLAYVPNSGMEHQTMITYGDKFNYKKVGGQLYSDNLFHEYAHEWWANKVTNKDWAHMWIQEGIATYAEALAFRELGGEDAYFEVMSGHKARVKNVKPLVQGAAVNSVDTYSGDLYFKGSSFMHALRGILGDEIFFPTLYKLATDSAYTYYNMVTSADVEKLFSKASGKNLQPLFDLYLTKTELLNFQIKNTKYKTYTIQITNLSMDLPVEIFTDKGIQKMILPKAGITIQSSTPPIVDPNGYFLKKVIME